MSVRKRGPRAYQVRVYPFPAKTLPTKDAAERYELELLVRRAEGDRYVEPARMLGEEIDAWLRRWKAMRRRSPRTVEHYERSAKFWECMRKTRVHAVVRAVVEDLIAERASDHPRSAKNELELLKRVLRDARARGQRIDDAVLEIEPVRHMPRRGRAIDVEQLFELASWFPEHSKRLVLLAGMIGARQRVWFEMTDALLDLDAGIFAIPPELSKNGKAHRIFLNSLEVKLFREQLLVRTPGTALVFPTPTGKRWTRSGFRERVWLRAVRSAVSNDAQAPAGSSVFDGLTFHLLRHTACSLMAAAGVDPAAAAERAGHTDGGALFLRTYRHLYEDEKRSQARRLERKILCDLDGSWTDDELEDGQALNEADPEHGRTWDRTRDLSRVKRALSR